MKVSCDQLDSLLQTLLPKAVYNITVEKIKFLLNKFVEIKEEKEKKEDKKAK